MPKDTTLPRGEPGQAYFATETFGNPQEPRFSDSPSLVTTHHVVDGPFSGKLYDVVTIDGTTIALADQTAGPADAILAAGIEVAPGETMSVPVYRTGHWSMDALGWDDATYDTDAKKSAAFQGSPMSPTILVSKKKYSSDSIKV